MGEQGYVIREAGMADLYGVLVVQLDAFGRVAQGLGIPTESLPPLNEPIEELERLLASGTRFWVAESADGHIIGSVRGKQSGERVEIGRLVVARSHLRQGVATALMAALEQGFPGASVFELFTGKDARVALELYRKLGYTLVREESTPQVTLVWLEKVVGTST